MDKNNLNTNEIKINGKTHPLEDDEVQKNTENNSDGSSDPAENSALKDYEYEKNSSCNASFFVNCIFLPNQHVFFIDREKEIKEKEDNFTDLKLETKINCDNKISTSTS